MVNLNEKLDEVMAQIREKDHEYAEQLKSARIGERGQVLQSWSDDCELKTLETLAKHYLTKLRAKQPADGKNEAFGVQR